MCNAASRCQAELGGIAADGIGQLRAAAHQPVADPDQHQSRLLLRCLHRHEAHRRPAHCLAQRLSVRRIVLALLDIGLSQLRRYQLHLMPERLQQPCPMMAATAGFDRDHRRFKFLEERYH